MARIFGYKWTQQYGPKDDGTWSAALADLTEQEIYAGLNACVRLGEITGDVWPPSAPEFRLLCRPAAVKRENAAAYRMALPNPPLTDEQRERGREQLAKLKALASK